MTRMKHIKPLEIDAPLDRFSEARAIEHVVKLSKDIDGRQVSNTSFGFITLLISKLV